MRISSFSSIDQDSQVAILSATASASRVVNLYHLMDAAFDAKQIRPTSGVALLAVTSSLGLHDDATHDGESI
jgi:hypothetical protein